MVLINMRKVIYIVIGLISVALGAVGVFLPVLPTTPLLLLAAFCFARSSERLDAWFKGTKLYKNNLETFARGEGMTRGTKIRIMVSVSAVMLIAFIAMRNTTVGRICIAVVWICHVIALTFIVKTCPEGGKERSER